MKVFDVFGETVNTAAILQSKGFDVVPTPNRALFLASVGLYGIISYSVGARTREIGTRMALGASGADVLRLVVREGMAFVGIGVVAGTLAAVALSRVLSFLLYGISPLDPLSFILAAAVLGTVALAANIIPARSASRIDPMKALGSE